MKHLVFRLSLLVLMICLAHLTPVQAQRTDESVKKEAEQAQQLRQKTYLLVDEIATGALSLRLPDNRSFLLSEAADLIWEQDEKRARSLFWDAYNTIGLIQQIGDDSGDKKKREGVGLMIFALRRQLLLKAARRDYRLARDLLISAHPLPPELQGDYRYLPDVEQEMAAQAATRDPKFALQLARDSLHKALNHQVIQLLLRLHELDRELGSKFAGEIIDQIQTRNLATDFMASGVAVQLVMMGRGPQLVAGDNQPYEGEANPLKLTREQKRQLVDLITNGALSGGKNGALLYTLPEIMAEIQEFFPERVALVQRKLAAFNQTLNPEQKSWQRYNSAVRTRDPEQIVAAAQKVDNQQQQRMFYREAAILAVLKNRAGSFREYIEDEVRDEGQRKEILDLLTTEQISAAAIRGDIDELRTLLPRVGLKEERARASATLAVILERKGKHEEALKLLNEAYALVKIDFNSESQTNALLAVIAAYAMVEPQKAFVLIERVIDNANDQISKLLLLDKIIKTGAVKQGEISLRNSGISLDSVMYRYGKALGILAQIDFDRTKLAADRLDRPELKLLARLTLAKVLLRSDSATGMMSTEP